jgi:hypothetical protein
MLSIQECRAVLEQFDYDLKDDEIMQLRDFLMMIATYQIIDNKLDTNEESNTILPSEQ